LGIVGYVWKPLDEAAGKDQRSIDLISDVLPFGRLWYGEPSAVSNQVGFPKVHSRPTWCCDSRVRL